MPKPADFRTRLLAARFTEADAARHEQRAAEAGVSISDLIRAALDGAPLPRRTARPTADLALLGQLVSAVGKTGSNVNQLAHVANAGSWPEARLLDQAVADIRWMRATLMQALGVEPDDPSPPHKPPAP